MFVFYQFIIVVKDIIMIFIVEVSDRSQLKCSLQHRRVIVCDIQNSLYIRKNTQKFLRATCGTLYYVYSI